MENFWHKSTGRIVYDPYRGGMSSKWWCVVDVNKEITRYYRWWISKERWMSHLEVPSWDAHISIVRGETPRNPDAWKKYHGKKIEFEYAHCPRQTGDTTGDRPSWFWFVTVRAPILNEIRGELGLMTSRDGVPFKHHLTVGRTYY